MPETKRVKQLVVVTPNEVGTLERICKAIQDAGTGLSHICASTLGDDAHFMLAAHDIAKARTALEALEYDVTEADILEVELDNVAGSLGPVATQLSKAGVDIEFLYGTSADGHTSKCVMSTNDNDRAAEVISWT